MHVKLPSIRLVIGITDVLTYETTVCIFYHPQSVRLKKVLEFVDELHSLCNLLDLDFCKTLSDVHPSLQGTSLDQATNICDATLEGLDQAILKLKTERTFRFQKVFLSYSPKLACT